VSPASQKRTAVASTSESALAGMGRGCCYLASSSRTPSAAWAASDAAYLTSGQPSVSVRGRPPLSVAIVTHLVTRFTAESAAELATSNALPIRGRRLHPS